MFLNRRLPAKLPSDRRLQARSAKKIVDERRVCRRVAENQLLARERERVMTRWRRVGGARGDGDELVGLKTSVSMFCAPPRGARRKPRQVDGENLPTSVR